MRAVAVTSFKQNLQVYCTARKSATAVQTELSRWLTRFNHRKLTRKWQHLKRLARIRTVKTRLWNTNPNTNARLPFPGDPCSGERADWSASARAWRGRHWADMFVAHLKTPQSPIGCRQTPARRLRCRTGLRCCCCGGCSRSRGSYREKTSRCRRCWLKNGARTLAGNWQISLR